MEPPHSVWLCWCYSVDVDKNVYETELSSARTQQQWENRLLNQSSRPLFQGGAHEPASCKCSSCSQNSYWQEIHRHLKLKQCLRISNSHTKVQASLSPEFHSILKPPLGHGCGDIFSLRRKETLMIPNIKDPLQLLGWTFKKIVPFIKLHILFS